MRHFLIYIPAILIVLQGCGSPMQSIVPSGVRAFHGTGYQSFQVDEYRIWLSDSEWPGDSCKSSALVADLCRTGILTGRMFYVVGHDSSLPTPNTVIPLENKLTLEEDFKSFRGKPTYIEHAWIRSIRSGPQVDTLVVGLSADLSGKLPGPMRVYGLTLTCVQTSKPCYGEIHAPRLVSFKFDGWVL